MPDSTPPSGPPASDSEAHDMLVQLAGRRTAPIPPELLVRHALALPGSWDWPVRRAAFEAILRRLASVRAQEIGVVDEPRRGPWGRYRLARADGDGTLPYDVRLSSVAPVRGACDCPDFLRASLAICKHLLAVVAHLATKPRAWRQIEQTPAAPAAPCAVVWEAAVAAPGPMDPLGPLRLSTAIAEGRGKTVVPAAAARLFRRSTDGSWRLATTHADDLGARMRLVRALQDLLRKAGAAADPAAQAILAHERSRLERVLRLRTAAPRIGHALRGAKRRLYAYQKQGVARFLAEGRLVLADDMGLGKTTQAIAAASALYAAGLVRRGLLVVPAPLKPQWEREWRAVSDAPLAIVDGGAGDRRAMYASARRGFLATNYEQVVRDLDAILAWAPDLVVLDEAQRMKNWATKTALAVKRLTPGFRLVLTGTPMENRLEELASIVEWVDDRALEPKWRLVPWHSVYADGRREVAGARNLDSLRARLAPVLLRRVRTEVLAQLPARQDTMIPVDLTAEQRDAHDELMQPIAKLAQIARRRPLTQAEFLRLMSLLQTQRVIANGMAQLEFETTWPDLRRWAPTPKLIESLRAPKLLELRELVSSLVLTQQRKVVVFSQWRRMLELAAWAVSDLLAARSLRALFFTGQEGARRRTQNLVDFHDDPAAAVLFLTDAGGVGLNLQKAANACINLELPWNPAVLEQRIGRIHRLGQKRPIDVFNLVSRACIEERIAGLVADKRALFKGLFEGATDQLQFDRSAGGLLQVLERLTAPPASAPPNPTLSSSDDEAAEDRASPDAMPAPGASEVEPVAVAAGIDELVAAADPEGVAQGDLAPSPSRGGGGHDDVGRLFAALDVQRRADGGIRIEAPPHAAQALVSLFEGMARLLGATAAASNPVPATTNGAPDRVPVA